MSLPATRMADRTGNKYTSHKNRKKMKARQSSIYRNMELLLKVLLLRFQKVPKPLCYQSVAQKGINDLMNAMDAVTLALQTKDRLERTQILCMTVVSMTSVKTVLRVMHDISAEPGAPVVLSNRQYAEVLRYLDQIAEEMGRWISKSRTTEEERP